MKFTDLGDKGPDFIREMDSQGYRGSRDSIEDDAGKKEYYGKVANPKDVVDQGADILNKAYNDKEQDVDEAEEDAFMSKLAGLQQWDVIVMNNFYSGKYPDYSARQYSVVASSPEEARQVVLNNADYVLKDLLSRKLQSGKRVLPANSALPIEDKRVGDVARIKPGSLTTVGYKKMLTPDGVKSMKFASGKIVDVEGEQGVSEGSNDTVYPNAEVIKSKNGKPVGEIYQDGNEWGCFHYKADRGYDMIDSREDAIQALKDLHQETGRSRPDYTVKGVAEGTGNEAWAAGYKAFHDDVTKCPYAPGSEEAGQWNLGWESAQARGWDKEGVAEETDAPTKYRATVEYGPTAADAHFVTVTANSTEEAEAKVQAWCKKKGVRNPMITINGADRPPMAEVDEASLASMRDYFAQPDNNTVNVDNEYGAPERKKPTPVPAQIQTLINKMYHVGKITPQELEVLKNFQAKTGVNVGLKIKEAGANPYAIGMAQAMKSTGDKPPLKKSTINKAHEIARAIKKDK